MSVNGKLAPESVKPVPLSVAALIVTGAVPDDVSVNGSVALEFMVTLPKDSEVVLAVNCGVVAAVPVPESWIFVVAPLIELLLTVSCPVAVPVAVGSNCACTVTDWLGFSVTGKVAPATLNGGPLAVAALIVTGAVPVDVSVTDCVDAVLSGTFPKFTAAGLTVSCGAAAVVPDPPSETVAGPDASLLVTVSVPASEPSVVGSKVTVTVNC